MQIDIASPEAQRVFPDEPLQSRIVVPGPIVVEPAAVGLTPGEAKGIATRRAADAGAAKWLVAILFQDVPLPFASAMVLPSASGR